MLQSVDDDTTVVYTHVCVCVCVREGVRVCVCVRARAGHTAGPLCPEGQRNGVRVLAQQEVELINCFSYLDGGKCG